jgi:RHS repeat-associated protein
MPQRKWPSFDYDNLGNMTRVTRLSGTSNAVTTTSTYNGPFSQIDSATDPLGHVSTLSYDSLGRITAATDPLGHQTTSNQNGSGQLVSVTDALNNSVQYSYLGGDLATVTDPLGNVSSSLTDAVGRVVSVTDPLGNVSQYQYNNYNLLTQTADAQGNLTKFAYDPNGNLQSLTDANNHATNYTYDNMDRVQTHTDPLLRGPETYTYDVNGNLATATDRKGQVTAFSYDGLNRMTFVGFNRVINGTTTTYESTISYTYDAGNRMTQAVDSAGGTITRGYDGLDRLTSETTSQGSITYGYDAADRETSMQVAGQPQVAYTYDNADRLTQISQGTSTTSFSYDNANRRISLTPSCSTGAPACVQLSYSYDNASRLTGITYGFGSNTLGNLTYSYDQLGRRTQVGGSFARTGLPGTITTAIYDAANEVTNWNGLTLNYDQNSNMLSDGANTFTWNARNQVAKINNVSLQYDAFGRRVQNAAGTSFLYDGANAVQELNGSTVTANLLSGGVDEIFSRTDSSGAFTQLKDALGSTIALVDSNRNIQTSYTYDPYGGTSVTGTSNANEFQYAGRENEGNGLYFYRARYYSPLLGRFINEDPMGFAGSGPNLYAYVFDSPINLVDPFGLSGGQTGVMEPPVEEPPVTIPEPEPEPPVAPTPPRVVPFCAANPEICVGGVGAVATGAIVYYGASATSAEMNANAAYDQELQAIHKMNQALLAHPRPRPLAGRNCKKGDTEVDVCRELLSAEVASCRENATDEESLEHCLQLAYFNYNRCRQGLPPTPSSPPWNVPF